MCPKYRRRNKGSTRNNFPQLYKEVEEFIDSCEDLSEIAMPRLQKKENRSFGQTEHNLGKSTFEYFSRQCYEIFDTAAVKLRSRFDASKPGLKAYCGLFNSLFGSVDDEIKQYPEINSDQLKMELVVFTKRWKPSNFNEYLELRKSPEEVKAFFPNILGVVKLLLLKPVSSAECKRSFSCLRRLKTWLRSTVTQKRLNGVVLARVHQALIEKIDLSKVADNFVQKNDSHVAIFEKPSSS